MSNNWVIAAEGLELFVKKYQSPAHGRAIMRFCLSQGIIRSRGKAVSNGNASGLNEDLPLPFLDNQVINPALWENVDVDQDKAWQKAEFSFPVASKWSKFKIQIDEIEFCKSDIISVHGRKGIGGRSLKKVEWEAVTHELVDIAMNESVDSYDTIKSLENEISLRIGAGALSDSSLKGIISRVYTRHFLKN